MKKIISFLSAMSILMTASCSTAAAENTGDLYSLASSLGADTDYINIPDKFYKDPIYDGLIEAIGRGNPVTHRPITGTNALDTASSSDIIPSDVWRSYSDSSLGTSVLEVLVHNGALTPSDIMDGAGTLSEIDNYDDVKDSIEYYSLMRKNIAFYLSHNYLLNTMTQNERVDMLLDMADNSMKNGKYFLIMYSCYIKKVSDITVDEEDGNYMIGYENSENTYVQQVHSAVGMGVTDGRWEFDGKIYDKCILTLDNLAEKSFSEKTCLYINSQTKEIYIPAYAETVQGDLNVVSFDDTDMLNFNGKIKPVQDYPIENIDITSLTLCSKRLHLLNLNAEDKDGVKSSFDEKNYQNYYDQSTSHFYAKGKKLDFSVVDNWDDGSYMHILDNNLFADIGFKKQDAHVSLDNDAFTIQREVHENNKYHDPNDPLYVRIDIIFRDIENAPSNAPVWDFSTNIDDDIKLTPAENGFYAESSGDALLRYHMESYIGDDYDGSLYTNDSDLRGAGGMIKLSGNKVLISLKDNSACIYADNDNDGVFDEEFSKGDANCDGKIDATDASAVMQQYAAILSKPKEIADYDAQHYSISPYYDFNGDGIIDSSDASEILADYAKSST